MIKCIILGVVICPATAFAGNDSIFVSQSVPRYMSPGGTYDVTLTFRNEGTTTWQASSYKLGSKSPHGNTNWGSAAVPFAAGETIAPGQQKAFSFSVTAPTTPGVYVFQWQVAENEDHFGAWSDSIAIFVSNASNGAGFVTQQVPAGMRPGQQYAVSVTYRNTGGVTWTGGGDFPYGLRTKSPDENTVFGLSKVLLAAGESVAPGAEKTFTFWLTAPLANGTYVFQVQPFVQGVELFGAWSDPVTVTVTDGIGADDCLDTHYGVHGVVGLGNGDTRFLCHAGQWYDCGWGWQAPWSNAAADQQLIGGYVCLIEDARWQAAAMHSAFVSQTIPTMMAPAQTYEVSVTFANIGVTTWNGTGEPYRLGSKAPRDNVAWGLSRVELGPGESIAPGEQKTFTFAVTAPATPGTYQQSWQMLQESVAWFGANSPVVDVVVECASSTCAQQGVACGRAWDSVCQRELDCGPCVAEVCQ